MLIVILAISLIVLGIGIYVFMGVKYKEEWGIGLMIAGGVLSVLLLIPICIGFGSIATRDVKEDKVIMYEQENLEMETSIANAIEEYLEHEKNIFIEIKPNETQTYLVAYPELQASELIKYQMEVIKENKQQIKTLKSQIIDLEVWKFVLYFG